MSVPICHHLKEDGVYCGSPALNGRNYCYFHLNLRGRRLKSARARRRGDNSSLNLPFPEDMHAVQVSLAEIMWAIAEHRIDHKDAGLLLYSLQQASTNLNQTPRWQGQREAVPSNRPLRALNFPNFEQRFDLPANADLDADSECLEPRNLPQSVILSEERSDESKDPYVSVGCPVQAQLEREFSPEASSPEPDRIPLLEDEIEDLQMTEAEKLMFFNYCMQQDTIKDEERLKVKWLRQTRLIEQEDSERGAEFRAERAAWESGLAETRAKRATDAA